MYTFNDEFDVHSTYNMTVLFGHLNSQVSRTIGERVTIHVSNYTLIWLK